MSFSLSRCNNSKLLLLHVGLFFSVSANAEVSLAPIPDVTVLSGAPLHIPLDAFDSAGGPISFSFEAADAELVSLSEPTGNRSMRVVVPEFGEMVFELFEQRAPRVTESIINLVENGTYDGVIFHRIIDGFVIQGGDPTGTGIGDPSIPDFDDQFHAELQHTSSGVLSMAKTSQDDTNSSQFFITDVPTRFLDFNHSVFGQLVEGEDVRRSISQVATGAGDRPLMDVVMQRVEIFEDFENGLLQLNGNPDIMGETTETTVTVTAANELGESATQTFTVNVEPDPFNGGPFLHDLPASVTTAPATPLDILLRAEDVENDSVFFDAVAIGATDFELSVDQDLLEDRTAIVSVVPPDGFTGELELLVGVRPVFPSNTGGGRDFDTQVVNIVVETPPRLQAGDADGDFDFDQFDLIRVQIAAKYLSGTSATWGEGDWNGAPGGSVAMPPAGDGRFDQLDIIKALAPAHYLTGPYVAVSADGVAGDGRTSIGYDVATGEIWVDAPAGVDLTSINIDSASGVFTGEPAQRLGGSFDNDSDTNIFKATFGGSFGTVSFGNVAESGLGKDLLLADLSVVGSLAGGGPLGDVDLIYVPEPHSALILTIAAVLLAGHFRRVI